MKKYRQIAQAKIIFSNKLMIFDAMCIKKARDWIRIDFFLIE